MCFTILRDQKVFGSIVGVRFILKAFPAIGSGPRLNVNIHGGALTEGILTFLIVLISLGLSTKIPGSFFMKNWISSLSKLTLHTLGSDLTGGCMNPASVSLVFGVGLLCTLDSSFFQFLLLILMHFLGDGLGLCSWGSYKHGAHTCLLACTYRGNSISCVDFQIISASIDGGLCAKEDQIIGKFLCKLFKSVSIR